MDIFPRATHDGSTGEPTIGARLRVLRGEHGLSREGLAERAELSVDLIAKLEQDRRTSCRIDSLLRLANALGVEVSELIGRREQPGTERDGETTRVVLPPPSWAVLLRAEREARGWTKHEMARRLGRNVIDQCPDLDTLISYVKRWEAGKVGVSERYQFAYAAAFGVGKADLFESVYGPPTFGEMMRALMAERGISLRELSRTVHYDAGHLSQVCCDRKSPSRQLAERVDTALGADGELAALAPPGTTIQQPDAEVQPLQPDLLTATVRETGTVDDGDDMERRLLLQLAALGLGAGALGSSGQSLRRLVDLALTSEPRTIEDWELVCADHLHAIRTRPAVQVREEMLLDLLTVRRQIQVLGTGGEVIELHRVLAALSSVHANVLTRLGDHGSALRWWRTAREAADTSGDLDLRLQVRGMEAGFGLYGQHDPLTVLHLTQKARQIAGDKPSIGLVKIMGARAKALSLLGRHDDAKQVMKTFIYAAPMEASSSAIPAFWTSDQVHFTESWVYAGAGDEAEADQARDRVLAYAFLDYQYAANVRLHEALCTVVNGGIDQGARQAAMVLDTLPPSHRSHMITETGNTVLRAVPLDQHQRPAVREFREVLTSTAPGLRALDA